MIELKGYLLDEYLKDIPNLIVFFGSETCPLCQIVKEKVKIIEKNWDGRFIYVEGDVFDDICDEYDIESYPTLIKFIKGKEVKRITGDNVQTLLK